tara:strand:+ start:14002 stop:14517 length:516 start_codon:yes stop_codon:yes gene_type:complete
MSERSSYLFGRRCRELPEEEIKKSFEYPVEIMQTDNHIQSVKRSILVKVTIKKNSNLTGIYGLPQDIVRYISEFLNVTINYTLKMEPKRDYPFHPHKWSLVESNIMSEYLKLYVKIENKILDIDWSPAISPEAGILMMVSRIQGNLAKLLRGSQATVEEEKNRIMNDCYYS